MSVREIKFTPSLAYPPEAEWAGLRSGARGVHSSRTLMFLDLTAVLTVTSGSAQRSVYLSAITESNCLGKPTAATRKSSAQRLTELYVLDRGIALFRVFRRLWDMEQAKRQPLALLMAIARDPLLAATAGHIVSLAPGAEFQREPARQALRQFAGERFNADILDKVLRNAASSWTQSGHLDGRTFKKRRLIEPDVYTATFALYLSNLAGFRGADLFTSGWFAVLDCNPSRGRDLALDAKRLGLVDLRIAGDVIDLRLDRLDPQAVRR